MTNLTAQRQAGIELLGCLAELCERFREPAGNAKRYWHGGPSGLPIGGTILPHAKTGKGGHGRVYVSARKAFAWVYATVHLGAVYQVKPIGRLTAIPFVEDNDRLVFECDSARILSSQDIPADIRVRIERAQRAAYEAA